MLSLIRNLASTQVMLSVLHLRDSAWGFAKRLFSFSQVAKLLEKFSKDCKCDGDPCEKFGDYELKFKREKIESLIKKSEPERKAVEDGCLKVKECSEEFLKRVLPSGDGNTTPVIDGTIGRLEITVNDLVEQVTSQEAFVLRQIQLRKTVLSGCAEFVFFQESVQEVDVLNNLFSFCLFLSYSVLNGVGVRESVNRG